MSNTNTTHKKKQTKVDEVRQGVILLIQVIIIPIIIVSIFGLDLPGIIAIVVAEFIFYIGYKALFPVYEDDIPDRFI